MSPTQPEFVALNQKVNEIHDALIGDPMKGRSGIVSRQNAILLDLYGIGPDGNPIEGKENTVLKRLSGIEDNQKKVIWIFSGLLLAFTAAKVGLTALVDKLFSR